MFYCLTYYPPLGPELAESIDAIRREYDPTRRFFKPHITVIFPVPGSVGERTLIDHIERALEGWSPFKIKLGGFHKTRDHWLLLTLEDGADRMKLLYKAFYSGILAEYGREYVPHLGLGLCLKEGRVYNSPNPREKDFDREKYEEIMLRAKALPLPAVFTVENLLLETISDQWREWTSGRRATVPEDGDVVLAREFWLGK